MTQSMKELAEILELKDDSALVDEIEGWLVRIDSNTQAAYDWRVLLEFRRHVYCDGLYHAFGDGVCEQDEMENFMRALDRLGCGQVLEIIQAQSSKSPDERESEVLSLLSDTVLAQFVRENPSKFENRSEDE